MTKKTLYGAIVLLTLLWIVLRSAMLTIFAPNPDPDLSPIAELCVQVFAVALAVGLMEIGHRLRD